MHKTLTTFITIYMVVSTLAILVLIVLVFSLKQTVNEISADTSQIDGTVNGIQNTVEELEFNN